MHRNKNDPSGSKVVSWASVAFRRRDDRIGSVTIRDTSLEFARDGVALVRGLLDPAALELGRRGVDTIVTNPGPLAITASLPDEPAFVEDFRRVGDVPDIAAIALDPRIGLVAAALMASRTARLHHDHILVKAAGSTRRTPWHQDQPYYDVDGSQCVSLWIALDPVPIETSLECVRGTHLGPWLMPRTFLDREARWFPEGSLAEIPDYSLNDDRIVRYALEPGDAIAFHFLTVHGAPGARSTRRILSLRYVGDDVRRVTRPWRTSPPSTSADLDVVIG